MTASALARNGGPGHLISSTPSPPIQSPGHPSKNATDAPLPAQIRPQIRQRNHLLETGVPAPKRPRKDCPLLGAHRGRAVYLLYNGVLGDRRPAGGNVLTSRILDALPPHPDGEGARVVYGEAVRLSDATLARANVTFRQTPYSLRES